MLGLLLHFQYEDGSIVVNIPKERWFNKLTVDSILTAAIEKGRGPGYFRVYTAGSGSIYSTLHNSPSLPSEARCNQVLPICSKNSGQ